MADIFISYKRERRLAADHLAKILSSNGYTVWFDYRLIKGQGFDTQLEAQLAEAKAVVVLWCDLSVKSDFVRSEATEAKNLGKLIPLKIAAVKVPLFFNLDDTIDLLKWDGSPRSHELDPVFEEIERLVGRISIPDVVELRDYERTWRRFGSLKMSRFPLQDMGAESPVPAEPAQVSPSPLSDSVGSTQPKLTSEVARPPIDQQRDRFEPLRETNPHSEFSHPPSDQTLNRFEPRKEGRQSAAEPIRKANIPAQPFQSERSSSARATDIKPRDFPIPPPRIRPKPESSSSTLVSIGIVGTFVAFILGAGAYVVHEKNTNTAALVANIKEKERFDSQKNQLPSSSTSADSSDRPKDTSKFTSTQIQTQRAVLYEEDEKLKDGKQSVGTVTWRTGKLKGIKQQSEVAIFADISIPERNMSWSVTFRRNDDDSLPASHTIELMVKLPFSLGTSVTSVPGVMMKTGENARGTPLAGLSVKVTDGYFLFGLSKEGQDKTRNLQMLKERSWFDVPAVYANQKRSILSFEKGAIGERAFADAFAAWAQ